MTEALDEAIRRRLADLATPAARLRLLADLAAVDRDTLARASGLGYWRTVKILQGKAEPSPDELRRLAEGLGVHVEEQP